MVRSALQVRPLYAVMAILLICIASGMFTGAPLVNAQTEDLTLIERIARMEGILEQINERLVDLNHLSERIDALHSEINNGNRNMMIAIFSAIILTPFAQSLSKRLIDRS